MAAEDTQPVLLWMLRIILAVWAILCCISIDDTQSNLHRGPVNDGWRDSNGRAAIQL